MAKTKKSMKVRLPQVAAALAGRLGKTKALNLMKTLQKATPPGSRFARYIKRINRRLSAA